MKRKRRPRLFGIVRRRGTCFQALWPDGKLPAKDPSKPARTRYRSKTFSTRKKADAFLDALHEAQANGLLPKPNEFVRSSRSQTLAHALDEYIRAKQGEGRSEATISQYRIILARVKLQGLGNMRVSQVESVHITNYLAWRRCHVWRTKTRANGSAVVEVIEGATASNVVLERERGLLSSLYRKLMAERVLDRNPVQFVKRPRKLQTNKRPFEPAEVLRFLDACTPEIHPLALCGFYTGLGANELIRLRWRDVSFVRHNLSIVRQKTGRLVRIELHPHLETELKALQQERVRAGRIPAADECCFLSRYGRPFSRFPRTGWNAILQRSGLEGLGLTPHAMRRTFATFYPGTDRDCQEILGHKDLTTTLYYRNARADRMRDAIHALDYGFEQRRRTNDAPSNDAGSSAL